MRVNVRIGLHDFEKIEPQPLDVSIELFAAPDYLENKEIIDYAKLHDAILAWEERAHVELIEAYLKELITLGFSFSSVDAVRASISKPEIFEKTNAAGLGGFIQRQDWRY